MLKLYPSVFSPSSPQLLQRRLQSLPYGRWGNAHNAVCAMHRLRARGEEWGFIPYPGGYTSPLSSYARGWFGSGKAKDPTTLDRDYMGSSRNRVRVCWRS